MRRILATIDAEWGLVIHDAPMMPMLTLYEMNKDCYILNLSLASLPLFLRSLA